MCSTAANPRPSRKTRLPRRINHPPTRSPPRLLLIANLGNTSFAARRQAEGLGHAARRAGIRRRDSRQLSAALHGTQLHQRRHRTSPNWRDALCRVSRFAGRSRRSVTLQLALRQSSESKWGSSEEDKASGVAILENGSWHIHITARATRSPSFRRPTPSSKNSSILCKRTSRRSSIPHIFFRFCLLRPLRFFTLSPRQKLLRILPQHIRLKIHKLSHLAFTQRRHRPRARNDPHLKRFSHRLRHRQAHPVHRH